MLTFQPGSWTDYAFVQGRAALPDDDQREIHNDVVGPGFFAAMGTPITLGRGFRMSDTSISPKVAVVNETMARRFFPGESPIGLRFGLSPERSGEFEVVGVVKDAKYESLREEPTPMAFYPNARGGSLGQFVVRYVGDVRTVEILWITGAGAGVYRYLRWCSLTRFRDGQVKLAFAWLWERHDPTSYGSSCAMS